MGRSGWPRWHINFGHVARLGRGQIHRERAAPIHACRGCLDAPAVQLGQATDDRQPETGAAKTPRRRRFSLVEAFPDALHLARFQADARVFDTEYDLVPARLGFTRLNLRANPDRPALGGELDRVHQQVRQDLLQTFVIGPHRGQIGWDLAHLDPHTLGRGDHTQAGYRAL